MPISWIEWVRQRARDNQRMLNVELEDLVATAVGGRPWVTAALATPSTLAGEKAAPADSAPKKLLLRSGKKRKLKLKR